MFQNCRFIDGINLAFQKIEKCNDLEKVKKQLLKFKEAKIKDVTDCAIGSSRSTIETASVITNYYFVTVKDGGYTLTEHQDGDKVEGIIYWSESTRTQYVVVLHGDFDEVAYKTNSGDEFHDNIIRLIGIADDWVIINRPMAIDVTNDWQCDLYEL